MSFRIVFGSYAFHIFSDRLRIIHLPYRFQIVSGSTPSVSFLDHLRIIRLSYLFRIVFGSSSDHTPFVSFSYRFRIVFGSFALQVTTWSYKYRIVYILLRINFGSYSKLTECFRIVYQRPCVYEKIYGIGSSIGFRVTIRKPDFLDCRVWGGRIFVRLLEVPSFPFLWQRGRRSVRVSA